MKPYSKDLRLRVLAAVDRGMPRKEVVRVFGISEPTVRRYLRLRRQTGDVEPKPPTGPPAPKGAALDATLPALKHGPTPISPSKSTASSWRMRAACALGVHHEPRFRALGAAAQKKTLLARERDERPTGGFGARR